MRIPEVAAKVLSAEQLRMSGTSRSALREAVRSGALIRVHRGWYVAKVHWAAWYPEPRHAAQAIAVARSMRNGSTVLSHVSAAVVRGLPLYAHRPTRVHVTGPASNGSVRAGGAVARHEASIEGAYEEIEGLPVTTLARTVADLAGSLPIKTAVALADAAFRSVAWVGGASPYDGEAAERFRGEIHACASLRRGARGSVQARWVVDFADGRAQLPGESVSRLYLHMLGFGSPRLQVRIPHSSGYYEVDFGLDDVGVWGEFDGLGKYTDPEMLADKSTAEAVLAEKHREDDIRGMTGRGLIRWGSLHIGTLEDFRARLAMFHVHPPAGAVVVAPGFRGPRALVGA